MPVPGPPPATLAEIQALMTQQGYTRAQVAAFAKWYAAAVKKDPALTPADGFAAWATAQDLGGGISAQLGVVAATSNQGLGSLVSNAPAPPSDPLTGIAGSLEAFYQAVTDGKLWRSLGWILLGIALMLFGVLLWIGPAGARRSPFGVVASVAKQAGT